MWKDKYLWRIRHFCGNLEAVLKKPRKILSGDLQKLFPREISITIYLWIITPCFDSPPTPPSVTPARQTHLPQALDLFQSRTQKWHFLRAVPELSAEVRLEGGGVVVQIFHDVRQALGLSAGWAVVGQTAKSKAYWRNVLVYFFVFSGPTARRDSRVTFEHAVQKCQPYLTEGRVSSHRAARVLWRTERHYLLWSLIIKFY